MLLERIAAGTGQFVVNGSWTKRFHVGNAAAGGVLAASLARRGYTGATQAFEVDAVTVIAQFQHQQARLV